MRSCPGGVVADGEKSAQAAITNYHGLGSLTTDLFSSQLCRLEVRDEGAFRIRFWRGPFSGS